MIKQYHYIWKTDLVLVLSNHHRLGHQYKSFYFICDLHSPKHPARWYYEWDTRAVHSDVIKGLFL